MSVGDDSVWVDSGLLAYLVVCTPGCLVLGSGRETLLCVAALTHTFLLVCGCGTSPRPISTGRLGIAAVYLRPINPIVCGGPYQVCPVGNFILKCASRLDAFSGYHVRT
jgi:hypothetical protein